MKSFDSFIPIIVSAFVYGLVAPTGGHAQHVTEGRGTSGSTTISVNLNHRGPRTAPPPQSGAEQPRAPRFVLVELPADRFADYLGNDGTLFDAITLERWRLDGFSQLLRPPADAVNLGPQAHMGHGGVVVGSADVFVTPGEYRETRAVYWPAGEAVAVWLPGPIGPGPIDFELPLSFASSADFAADAGAIAGTTYVSGPPEDSLDLPAVWSSPSSQPVAISQNRDLRITGVNSSGTAIGQLIFGGGHFVGTASVDFEPNAINDRGEVVGVGADARSGVYWRDGPTRSTGRFFGKRVNNRGDLLGTVDGHPAVIPADAVGRVIENPDAIDYDRFLIAFPSGWSDQIALDMNDSGIVLGFGLFKDPANPSAPSRSRDFLLVPATLRADINRDGEIRTDGSDASSVERPFRLWINDDDDSGDTGGDDIPRSASNGSETRNCDDSRINGARDLIDWFPVGLDIRALLQQYPPSFAPGDGGIRYKLKQSDGALNAVFTRLPLSQALKYQYEQVGAIYSSGAPSNISSLLADARSIRITETGIDVFWQFRDLYGLIFNQGSCVILVEGCASSTNDLVLSLEKTDGTKITELKLELEVGPVENMFRHLNLRDGPDAPSGMDTDGQPLLIGATGSGHPALHTELGDRAAFPDEPGIESWLFFVHGYNVSGEKARGWNSEMFKRFYWSGNKARFVGVTWFGNPNGPDVANIVQNYHWAVRNAVPTAEKLAQMVNALPGSKTFVAHSQGCWVTSVAIADFGMNVENACLVDAAFARECIDGEMAVDPVQMVPAFWRGFPAWSWSANWNQSFEASGQFPGDAREALRWRGRLAQVLERTNVYNFYSSTEDVLGAFPGEPTDAIIGNAFRVVSGLNTAEIGRFAWVIQEKTKGDKSLWTQGSTYGGWKFNLKDPLLGNDPLYWKWLTFETHFTRVPKAPSEIGEVSTSILRRNPLFERGWGKYRNQELQESPLADTAPVAGAPAWIFDLYQANGADAIASRSRTIQLLAEAIPAISVPLGSSKSDALEDNNYNLPARFVTGSWPSERGVDSVTKMPNWLHSDLRDVAYFYLFTFFDRMVGISENQP